MRAAAIARFRAAESYYGLPCSAIHRSKSKAGEASLV